MTQDVVRCCVSAKEILHLMIAIKKASPFFMGKDALSFPVPNFTATYFYGITFSLIIYFFISIYPSCQAISCN